MTMVVDSSALLCLYFDEPAADWVEQQINLADRLVMSMVNLAEVLMRIQDKDASTADALEKRLLAQAIQFIPPDFAQTLLAARARDRYPLNFGDCFAYALAKNLNLPLLTLDADFRATDIVVLQPTA